MTPVDDPPVGRAAPARFDILGIAVPFALLVIAVIGLAQGPRSPVDGYGLITALPYLYSAAVGAMIVVFLVCLLRVPTRPSSLFLQVGLIAITLSLAPTLLESIPRFATAYTHAGFMHYLQTNGDILRNYDARFSWPGFFAAAAMFSSTTGIGPDALLRWSPLILDLASLLALAAIVRRFTTNRHRRAFTLLLFVVFNWVGQDYFAPQGFAFLLYLVFIAIVVTLIPALDVRSPLTRFTAWILRLGSPPATSPEAEVAPLTNTTRVGLLLALVVTFGGIVVSHQLTPAFAILSVLVLTAFRYRRSWALIALLSVLFAAYISWGATDYWTGHLGDLTGGVGQLGSAVQQNIGSRFPASPSSPFARSVVVDARVGLALLTWSLALVGLLRGRSRRLIAVAALSVTPFLVLALQSYGGEAILRIQLFALPFLCILAANALRLGDAPSGGFTRSDAVGRGSWRSVVIASLVGCLTLVAFFLARYGNEAFEEMRPVDVNTVAELYRVVPTDAAVYSLNDSLPWKDQRVGEIEYRTLDISRLTTTNASDVLIAMRESTGPTYFITTESSWNEELQLDGEPADSIAALQDAIASTPWLRQVSGDVHSGVFMVEGNR